MLKVLPLLGVLLQAEEAIPYASNSAFYARSVIKSILIIALLLAGMYYWYKYVLPKMQSAGFNALGQLAVKERLVIEPGTTAYVLQLKDEHRLLIVSGKQTALYNLPKLKYQELPKKDFQEYLADFLRNKDNKVKGKSSVKK